jgi:hypothetical protein
MNRFQQYQMGESMVAAANSPAGGGAAEGMGLGIGLAMANRMTPLGAPNQPMPAAPPPPPVAVWHVAHQGQTLGPYSLQQITEAIGRAEIQASSMLWTAGMADWQAASKIPALASYFQAPPPPPKP